MLFFKMHVLIYENEKNTKYANVDKLLASN